MSIYGFGKKAGHALATMTAVSSFFMVAAFSGTGIGSFLDDAAEKPSHLDFHELIDNTGVVAESEISFDNSPTEKVPSVVGGSGYFGKDEIGYFGKDETVYFGTFGPDGSVSIERGSVSIERPSKYSLAAGLSKFAKDDESSGHRDAAAFSSVNTVITGGDDRKFDASDLRYVGEYQFEERGAFETFSGKAALTVSGSLHYHSNPKVKVNFGPDRRGPDKGIDGWTAVGDVNPATKGMIELLGEDNDSYRTFAGDMIPKGSTAPQGDIHGDFSGPDNDTAGGGFHTFDASGTLERRGVFLLEKTDGPGPNAAVSPGR